jgi:hypothetical protein
MFSSQNNEKKATNNRKCSYFDLSFFKQENLRPLSKDKKFNIRVRDSRETKKKKHLQRIFLVIVSIVLIILNLYFLAKILLSILKPILCLLIAIIVCKSNNIRIELIERISQRLRF